LALALFAGALTALVAWWPDRVGPAGADPVRGPGELLTRFRQGLRAVRSPRAIGRALGASLVAWALEVVVLTTALRAVGIHLPLAATIIVLMAINIMIAMPVTPGNLGMVEVGATCGLLQFGIDREKALAFAVCYHALQTLPVAALGFVVATREGLHISPFRRGVPWGVRSHDGA